jgi:prepilin-type N-terminal cleavage/methylation domain-containing protein
MFNCNVVNVALSGKKANPQIERSTKMRKKGFTLIELLVVIAIIAMLLAILMPALGRVKRLAERLVCGTNIRGLINASMIYANDYDDQLPIQGGNATITVGYETTDWDDPGKTWNNTDTTDITVAASLYLLIREADVGPKSFVCKGGDEKVFDGSHGNPTDNPDIMELWDFGGLGGDGTDCGVPSDYVSYAYHKPYDGGGGSSFPVSGSDSSGRAILADKSPFFGDELSYEDGVTATSVPGTITTDTWSTVVALTGWDDTAADWQKFWVQIGNSNAHGREGQNVGYGDGHVYFEKRPDCGIQSDNIYTPFNGDIGAVFAEDDKRRGTAGFRNVDPTPGHAKSDQDSFLINDDISKQ